MATLPPPGQTKLIDGRGVYVRRHDGPVGPTPVWFVHGLGGSSTNWTRLAAVLADRTVGFSVDLPGSGRSDPPPRGRYSLLGDADLVAAAIRRVSGAGPVHLVGNSLGGYVATLLAARHPDLVASLTLISPAVPDLRLTTDRGGDPRLALLLLPGTAGVAGRRLGGIDAATRARGTGRLCFGDPDLIDDASYEAAAADLDWRTGLPWASLATLGPLRSMMGRYLRPGRWSFGSAARSLTCPVLIVWGTRDRLVDVRLSRRTVGEFRDATLLVLPGVGHVAQMEDPIATARAILALWDRTDHTGVPHVRPAPRVEPSSS
nr:alpha/beta hydrolase [Nakamurella flavida]